MKSRRVFSRSWIVLASLAWPCLAAPLVPSATPGPSDYGHAAAGSDPRAARAATPAAPGAMTPAHAQAVQFVKTYCFECHNADKMKGDYDVTPLLQTRAVKENIPEWEEVLKQVAEQEMPPRKNKEAKRPTDAQYAAMAGWLQKEVALATGNAGRLARRLNRAEYNNTMRDLLGVDAHPADIFPQDLGREGFDNVAEAQSVSPLLLEKYLRAAREALAVTIVTQKEPEKMDRRVYPLNRDQRAGKEPTKPLPADLAATLAIQPEYKQQQLAVQVLGLDFGSGSPGKDGKPGAVREGKGAHGYEVVMLHTGNMGRRGQIDFKNPLAFGHYKLIVRAYAERAKNPKGEILEPTGACVLGLDVNAVRVAERSVPVVDQPQTFEFEFTTDREKSGVSFGAASAVNKADLPGIPNLVICDAEITGPIYDQWPPAPHRAIFGPDGQWALDEIFRHFLPRAFRRPVAPEEIAKYRTIAEEEIKAGSTKEEAVNVALQAILVSPNFLFLVEDSRADRKLNDYEFASRLSYFLWSSMPDDEILNLAKTGKIREPQTLRALVLRMLRDPKAEALVDNFAAQWIGFRRLGDIAPDPTVFKTWDEDLRKAMRDESENFFRYVMRENLSILNFLDSDFTFVNERLAKHYGIEGIKGADFQKVALKPELGRGGLLTQAGVLTLGSQPTRSSPVFRGKFVVEHLFNRPPPPPPANVPLLDESKIATPKNVREQLAQHASDPNCASCHVKIDPWGLALEGFDGIGLARQMGNDDVTGTLAEGGRIVGTAGLKKELLNRKDAFVRGLMEKTMLYACGRTMTIEDRQQVPALCTYVAKEGYKFHAMILATVFSPPFQSR
jgi:mono/diheme cytochrome c family protein